MSFEILLFYFHFSDIVEIINHLTSIELIGDPFLQLTLLAACLECKEMAYSLLLGFVAIPAIIWGLAIKIANTRKISSQVFALLLYISTHHNMNKRKYTLSIIHTLKDIPMMTLFFVVF